jgi:hypothetical protein
MIQAHQNTKTKPTSRKFSVRKLVSKARHFLRGNKSMSDRKSDSRDVIRRVVIPVTNFTKETFGRLLQYVHCGSVTIEPKTVVGELSAPESQL